MAAPKYKQVNSQPTQKVMIATLAALLTPILLGLLKHAMPDLPLPVEADHMIDQLLEGFFTAAVVFAAAWYKRPSRHDGVQMETTKTTDA